MMLHSVAAVRPPRSLPANSQSRRPITIPRKAFSAGLFSMLPNALRFQ